jgi:hypothetical protein
MLKYSLISLVVVLALASGACRKIVQLPPEPRIEYTSFMVFDTIDILGNATKAGRLKFYFEDGDGDIGFSPSDAVDGDTTNLYFTLFRKNGSLYTEAGSNDLLKPSSYRIPNLTRTGQNKILKGTISVTFLYLFYSPADNDTIKYEFYLRDRNENYSNTESTGEIALSYNNIYR